MKNAKRLALVIAIYAIATLPNFAGAAASFCPDDIGYSPSIEDNVNSNIGCQLGSTRNDRLGGDSDYYQVNLDMMFGFDDWIFAEKAFDNDQDIDIGLSLVGNTISGLWSIDDIWNTMGVSSLMLVFKGGNAEPDTFVAYLITPGTISGDYLTPFINAGSGNPKDISHVSAYFRNGPLPPTSQAIPEPGSIALLSLGILLMVRLLRKKIAT